MERDKSLLAVQQHLKLCFKLLQVRKSGLEQLPKGIVSRNNRIKHTQAMMGLLSVLRGMAAHDPVDWWDDKEDIPF